MTDKKYVIEALGKHNREEFSCGILELDNYLKTQASQDLKKNMSVTHVLTEKGKDSILGYYSISTIGIFPGDLPQESIMKLPRYPMLPGILLGRLAVDQKYRGQGMGESLLVDALKRSLSASTQIGIVAIVVDAKNEEGVEFYKHYGFLNLPENRFKLFLPLKTLKELDL